MTKTPNPTPEDLAATQRRLRDEVENGELALEAARKKTMEAEAAATAAKVAAKITPSQAADQDAVDAGERLLTAIAELAAVEDELAILREALEKVTAQLAAAQPTKLEKQAAARGVLSARVEAMKAQLQALAVDVMALSRLEGRRGESVGLAIEARFLDLRRLNLDVEGRIEQLAQEGLHVR